MFFTYCEKQGNVFFSDWKTRQVAFDCSRRYLYYSTADLKEDEIVPPNDITVGEAYLKERGQQNPTSPTLATEGRSFSSRGPSSPTTLIAEKSPEDMIAKEWKKKVKVDAIILIAKDRVIHPEAHVKEQDYYQIELHGETRSLAHGERPPPGPLLCPSTTFCGNTERMNNNNDDYLRDPFFLAELYEGLRKNFNSLKEDREKAAGERGETATKPTIQTIQSPRGKSGLGPKGSRISFIIRMRSELEFRRFWYVVQTVLGYDKLVGRPYRGLPPYDPRNGVVFAQLPVPQWHTFKDLDKTVIYSFMRCDLLGRNASGNITVTTPGVYLCVAHEMLMIMRDTGSIPVWVKIQKVHKFYYNVTSDKPYLAFIADRGCPDIIVTPQHPFFGEISIKYFNPKTAALKVYSVLKEICFGSIDVRRVTVFTEAVEPTVDLFVQNFEKKYDPLVFTPPPGYLNEMSSPVPKEQLAEIWREVQQRYAERDQEVIRQSAIPLYTNYMHDLPLTREQMAVISRRLAEERGSNDDIVGMSYGEAERVADQVNNGTLSISPAVPANRASNGLIENSSFCPNFNTSFAMGTSAQSNYNYGASTARYFTQDDLATSYVQKLPEVIVENHTVMSTSAHPRSPTHGPMSTSEVTMNDMINHSFAMYSHSLAKKAAGPLSSTPPAGANTTKDSKVSQKRNSTVDSLET